VQITGGFTSDKKKGRGSHSRTKLGVKR
jgi:hypothetical protein